MYFQYNGSSSSRHFFQCTRISPSLPRPSVHMHKVYEALAIAKLLPTMATESFLSCFPFYRHLCLSLLLAPSRSPFPPSSIYLFLLYLKLKTTSNIRQNNAGSVKTNQCARQILIEVGQIFKLHDTNCASTALVLRILAMVICIFVGFKWQWCWCYAIMYADKRRMFFGFKWLLVSVLLNGVASLIVKFTLKLINLKCDLFRSFSSLKIKHS